MWSFEHFVECPVSSDFAWQFWTNVSNWPAVDASVESVALDGPFRSGAKGSTKSRGGDPVHWRVAEVQDHSSAVIEVPLPGTVFRCAWRFEDAGSGRTRITQHLSIEGERAADYLGTACRDLEKGVPQGMQKLAEAMIKAASGSS